MKLFVFLNWSGRGKDTIRKKPEKSNMRVVRGSVTGLAAFCSWTMGKFSEKERGGKVVLGDIQKKKRQSKTGQRISPQGLLKTSVFETKRGGSQGRKKKGGHLESGQGWGEASSCNWGDGGQCQRANWGIESYSVHGRDVIRGKKGERRDQSLVNARGAPTCMVGTTGTGGGGIGRLPNWTFIKKLATPPQKETNITFEGHRKSINRQIQHGTEEDGKGGNKSRTVERKGPEY